MTTSTRTAAFVGLVFVTLTPQAHALPCDFSQVDARVQTLLARFPMLEGAAIAVGDRHGLIHEAYFGDYAPTTVVPIASASKLVSATAVMTLIDSGQLLRNAPVRRYLPAEFTTANAGLVKPFITIDQCYSMTSGYPSEQATQQLLGDLTITNDQAVEQVACCVALDAAPNTGLLYSGVGMHIVGRICEVITAKPWDIFFDDALARPLNTPSIEWDGLGETENFRPSGGAESNLRDYAKVLRLLLRRGELDGTRLLSEAAVNSMFTERTAGLPIIDAPPDVFQEGYGYAFGMWVAERDTAGNPTVVTSPGAFGFTPTIDLADNYFFIIMVRGIRQQLLPDITAAIQDLDTLMTTGCSICPADLNRDGTQDIFDLYDYLALFDANIPSADINQDHAIDIFDLFDYLTALESPCPNPA